MLQTVKNWCLDLLGGLPCVGCTELGSFALCEACLEAAIAPRQVPLLGAWEADAWGLGPYRGPLREAIRSFKFRKVTGLAPILAQAMAASAPPPDPDAWLVPIPLHPARQRHRSFNQAQLLARELSRIWRRPCVEVLARRQVTPPLYRLDRETRWECMRDAFVLVKTPGNRPLLLVDDVMTTGATLTCAALTLEAGGGRRILALTAAFVPLLPTGSPASLIAG